MSDSHRTNQLLQHSKMGESHLANQRLEHSRREASPIHSCAWTGECSNRIAPLSPRNLTSSPTVICRARI